MHLIYLQVTSKGWPDSNGSCIKKAKAFQTFIHQQIFKCPHCGDNGNRRIQDWGALPQRAHILIRLNIAVTFGKLLTSLLAIIEADNNNLN